MAHGRAPVLAQERDPVVDDAALVRRPLSLGGEAPGARAELNQAWRSVTSSAAVLLTADSSVAEIRAG